MGKVPAGIATALASLSMMLFSQVAQAAGGLPAYYKPQLPPYNAGVSCAATPALPPGQTPPIVVRQNAPPGPGDNCTSYLYGPLSDASGINTSQFTRTLWRGGKWPSIWVNRALRPPNVNYGPIPPNPINPLIYDPTPAQNYIGLEYTTVAKANAATTAMTLRMLGAPIAVWEAPLKAAGFIVSQNGGPSADLISYSDLAANPAKYFNFSKPPNSSDGQFYVFHDKMVLQDLPNWTFTQNTSQAPTGVFIDYEVNDFRPAPSATIFLVGLARQIHQQPFKNPNGTPKFPMVYLYTNPWNGPWNGGAGGNGFDFLHIDEIKASFDYMSLYPLDNGFNCTIASQNGQTSAYDSQVSFLKGVSGVIDFSKVILTYDLLRCSAQAAIDAHNRRATDGFAGYDIFDKGQALGGHSTPLTGSNLQIWNLLYGTSQPVP